MCYSCLFTIVVPVTLSAEITAERILNIEKFNLKNHLIRNYSTEIFCYFPQTNNLGVNVVKICSSGGIPCIE